MYIVGDWVKGNVKNMSFGDLGVYIIFYQYVLIDHVTHVPGPVAQSSLESEYIAACTAGMDLAIF